MNGIINGVKMGEVKLTFRNRHYKGCIICHNEMHGILSYDTIHKRCTCEDCGGNSTEFDKHNINPDQSRYLRKERKIGRN